jgi:AAA+ superfamily predicted ATPase
VAEMTGRPLLTVTAGDIGSTAEKVETNLDRFFNLAQSWRAILLLDEADVYLGNRRRNDIERNSVISVFLRALEYYRGILFITTNRVGDLDEAFKSRIHLPIYYKNFTDEMRARVWENNFRKLMKERGDHFEIDWDVTQFVKKDSEVLALKWNGRQIRNGTLKRRPVLSFGRFPLVVSST